MVLRQRVIDGRAHGVVAAVRFLDHLVGAVVDVIVIIAAEPLQRVGSAGAVRRSTPAEPVPVNPEPSMESTSTVLPSGSM